MPQQIIVTMQDNGSVSLQTNQQLHPAVIIGIMEFAKNALMNVKPEKVEPNIVVAPADALNHINNRLPHQG